jgi:predicted dehydrogenase
MRIGVLGLGGMGRGVIEHARGCPNVESVIGYDISSEVRANVAEKQQIDCADSLEALLADPAVKLVFVTASNAAHKPLVMAALQAGKAVMCEKPIATTLEDAEAMVAAAERLGAYFQIGFECRYSRAYTQIKDWIDAGLLGEVNNTNFYYISSEFHKKGSWRNQLATGGSMFGEKLSHYVDLPRWWIGSEVVDIFTACAPNVIPYFEVRDNYQTTYRFANGAVSHLTFMMAVGETFHGDPTQDHLEQQKDDGHALRFLIGGTQGAVEIDVFRRSIKRWAYGDSPECLTSTIVERITWTPDEDQRYYHNNQEQTQDIIQRVANGLPPHTPARDALQTMRLCFAADRSADSGEIVRVETETGKRCR